MALSGQANSTEERARDVADAPRFRPVAVVAGAVIVAAVVLAGYGIFAAMGREAAFSWIAGGVFGWVLQRTRFCFLCNLRDFLERREPAGALAILLALAVGLIGYHVVTGAWIVDAFAGHLPPKAHIAPVGWNLVLGGLAFGAGMGVSGSCISAHLYRLGEGSFVCLFALIGGILGFLVGFLTWNPIYLALVSGQPVIWLPATFGFGGSLLLQLGVLGLLFLAVSTLARHAPAPTDAGESMVRKVLFKRWPAWVGGLIIGLLAAAVLLRTEPLGVTSELTRAARFLGNHFSLLPERMEGLDTIRGCASRPAEGLFSRGFLFISALVLGSLGSALMSNEFEWERPSFSGAFLALAGGVLLGWGAMVSFGCTVGTLLSGIHASSLSGWLFGVAVVGGILLGLPVRRRFLKG
ncbi:MAG TPA: YeeE/YedE family protein [Terrimicrobiaceae bacterium]